MAVEAICPICGAVFNVRDDMSGKKVRCTKCEQVFTVGGERKARERAEQEGVQTKSATRKSPREDDDATERKSRAAARRGRDDDDDDDDKKGKGKNKRVYHDEEEDDDKGKPKKLKDQVQRKGSNRQEPGLPVKTFVLAGGALLILLLICGGGVYGVYALMSGASEAAQEIANDVPAAGNPGLGQGPMQPAPPAKRLASVEDALGDLNSDNLGERHAALDWLARSKLEKGRQHQVSKALDPFLKDPDAGTRERAVNALKVWGTKENVPGLVKILEETQPGLIPNFAHGAIEVLGMLQDERGAEPVWKFREGAFTNASADKALRAMGQAAGEKAALGHMNDPNNHLRGAARTLLVYYGTKDEAKLDQVVADVQNDDKSRRGAATEYLATNPVVEAQRLNVSKALNVTLSDPEEGIVENGIKALEKWYTADNVPALITVLDDDQFRRKHQARKNQVIALLGKIKDPRSAEPLAKCLTVPGERRAAGDALIALGPAARPAAEKYITDPDGGVRKEATRVVQALGADTGNIGLTQAIADLGSPDGGVRGRAAANLARMKVDAANQVQVAKALEKAAAEAGDRGAQEGAVKALGVWGTKENGPALLKLIEDREKNSPQVRHLAMEQLGKWKCEEAVKPLAEVCLGTDKGDREAAAKALIAMGPELGHKIEGTVREGLKSRDKAIILECCKVLGAVGTKASNADLTALRLLAIREKKNDVAGACDKALKDIAAR
jgi:predicted Zn finger-like uncharacterized protein